MNFYKIFYFNFYMFFYHLIVVLPIDNYFQIYQIIFFFKCAQSNACFEPRLLEAPALKCAGCFYSLSLSLSLREVFIRYDGHVLDPLAILQFTRRTYYTPMSNIKQLDKDLCGGWCVLFLEGGCNLESVILSGRFTTLPFCMKHHLPRVKQVI